MRNGVARRGDRSSGSRLARGALERRAAKPARRRGRAPARPRLAHLRERGALPQPGRGADRARRPAGCRRAHHLRQCGFAALLGTVPAALLGTTREVEVVESGEMRQAGRRSSPGRSRDPTSEGDTPRWFAFVETVTTGRDGRPEVLRAGRDVTDRVESARVLEEARSRAEAASVAKSRFIASVSHEFRTPAQRHHGHGRPDAGDAPEPRAAHLCRGREDLRRGPALAHRRHPRLLQDRGRPPRPRGRALRPGGPGRERGRALAPRAQDKGLEIAADIETLPAVLVATPTGCGRS